MDNIKNDHYYIQKLQQEYETLKNDIPELLEMVSME